MTKLGPFFKSIRSGLIMVVLVHGIFAITFHLTNLPMEVFWLAFQVSGFLLLVYLVLKYFGFQQEERNSKIVRSLQAQIGDLKSQRREEIGELQAYFLTWIHQMKTPITAAKLLADEHREVPAMDEVRRELFAIETYANMAMTYLKLNGLDRNLDIAPVSLDKVIRGLLRSYSLMFIHHKVTLDYETIPDEVVTDGQWLSILIELLLSNAVKYSPGGRITIRYDRDRSRLDIQDTGEGIPARDLPRIFDRGYSGFNGRLNQKSSGLGLYLAQAIAQRLSIEIKVQSKQAVGSTFSLIFPDKPQDFME